MRKKRRIMLGINLFLLSGTLLLTAGGVQEEPVPVQQKLNGRIEYLEGVVSINEKEADFGDSVDSGAVIRTGEESLCEIVFGDGNIMRIGAETHMVIHWEDARIELDSGGFGAVMSKLDQFVSREAPFEVVSESVVMGVRGTSFFVMVQADASTYVCTCNGTLELTSPVENFFSSSARHKAYVFRKSGDTVISESAGLLYHDDAAMESLAEKIGYTINWDSIPGEY